MRKLNDDVIYTPEAIAVGILLFGSRVCSGCGAELADNSDYFTPDTSRGGRLTTNCRRCRREGARRRYALTRAAT